MNKFKPMLAIDATDHLDKLKYPKYASYKLDGIRCCFHPSLGIVSRALKQIPNIQLRKKFKVILDEAKRLNRLYDGEFYCHDLTFQEITRAVMTKDLHNPKTLKKLKWSKEKADELIGKIKFHCFETYYELIKESFMYKQEIIKFLNIHEGFVTVKQTVVNSEQDVRDLFKVALDDGYEGLILRGPKSPYKFGRSTIKEEYMLKVKPFETFDAKIIDVIQGTEVDPESEKKTNELGRSVTSRKKDDRVLINRAACFLVEYNGNPIKVSIAMTNEEKANIWKHKESYIGRHICYKGMLIGSKNVPRHPVMLHFREDLDE